ncbi:MAG: hypothetical protein LBI67_00675 [Treponema sp.]|jgi:hypothetical protein|nr:hypothetical protein [Treponema sp.]
MIRILTDRECTDAMKNGAFDPFPGTGALILTQSWCPQWKAMKKYLSEAENRPSAAGSSILYVEYDTRAFFESFMAFKENTFKNREIPYVRYFRDGVFSGESNYVSLQGFLHRLSGPGNR